MLIGWMLRLADNPSSISLIRTLKNNKLTNYFEYISKELSSVD